MLRATPFPEPVKPVERFVAEVELKLPRHAEGGMPSPIHRGWLVPAALAAALTFFQVVMILSGVLVTARGAGLLDGAVSWLPIGSPQSSWFLSGIGLVANAVGANGFLYAAFQFLGSLQWTLTTQLAWQAGIGLLYWAGLVYWWIHRNRSAFQTPSQYLLSNTPQ